MVKINNRNNVDIFSVQNLPLISISAIEKSAIDHSTLHEVICLNIKLCPDSLEGKFALSIGAPSINQALLTATLGRCSITDNMLGEDKFECD